MQGQNDLNKVNSHEIWKKLLIFFPHVKMG